MLRPPLIRTSQRLTCRRRFLSEDEATASHTEQAADGFDRQNKWPMGLPHKTTDQWVRRTTEFANGVATQVIWPMGATQTAGQWV